MDIFIAFFSFSHIDDKSKQVLPKSLYHSYVKAQKNTYVTILIASIFQYTHLPTRNLTWTLKELPWFMNLSWRNLSLLSVFCLFFLSPFQQALCLTLVSRLFLLHLWRLCLSDSSVMLTLAYRFMLTLIHVCPNRQCHALKNTSISDFQHQLHLFNLTPWSSAYIPFKPYGVKYETSQFWPQSLFQS